MSAPQHPARVADEALADQYLASGRTLPLTPTQAERVHIILLSRAPELQHMRLRSDVQYNGEHTYRWELRPVLRLIAVWLLSLWVVGVASAQTVVIDHTTLPAFDQLTTAQIDAAAVKRVLVIDRSVGQNIAGAGASGLGCMNQFENTMLVSGAGWGICNRDHPAPLISNGVPQPDYRLPISERMWTRKYSNANITYKTWPGGTGTATDITCINTDGTPSMNTGYWYGMIDCALIYFEAHITEYDVFTFNISYLELTGDIASPTTGMFAPGSPAGRRTIADIEAFITRHPDKQFIFMAPSLSRASDQIASQHLQQYRAYMATRPGRAVFLDLASIESRMPNGDRCNDNRDGLKYVQSVSGTGVENFENWPDDGVASEAVCQQYVLEKDGGHISNPSVGMIRAAKGFWQALVALDQQVVPPPPPTFPTCAPNQTVPATDATGAIVTFDPPGYDGGAPPVRVDPVPVSGSTFAIGSTSVVWTATDALGRTAQCSHVVTVEPLPDPSADIEPPGSYFSCGTRILDAKDFTCSIRFMDNVGVVQFVIHTLSIMDAAGNTAQGGPFLISIAPDGTVTTSLLPTVP